MASDASSSVEKRRHEVINGDKNQLQTSTTPLVDQSSNVVTTNTPPSLKTMKRTSKFRGVSRQKGRYEAHLWDKDFSNGTQKRKGKQVYIGAYDEEESAARAYDLARIKYWGMTTFTNFPVSEYEKELEIMRNTTKEEYLSTLRRRSNGFSNGVSKYRGVSRHHDNGRWEARLGNVCGEKYIYLGTHSTQVEAAHAYDIAAIEHKGINVTTNFPLSTYIKWMRSDSKSNSNLDSSPPPSTISRLLSSSVFNKLAEKELNAEEHTTKELMKADEELELDDKDN